MRKLPWIALFLLLPCLAQAEPILCQWTTYQWMSGPPEARVLDEGGRVRTFTHDSTPQRTRGATSSDAVRLAAQAAPVGDPVPPATMARLRDLIAEAAAGTIVQGPTGSRGAWNFEIQCFVAAHGKRPHAVLVREVGGTNRSNASAAAAELVRLLMPVIGPSHCRGGREPAPAATGVPPPTLPSSDDVVRSLLPSCN